MPKTDTCDRIYKFIKLSSIPVRPKDIVDEFGLSNVIVHRHLRRLESESKIQKFGTPPRVFYRIQKDSTVIQNKVLEKNWLTITPDGQRIPGERGFVYWCENRGFDPGTKIEEYLRVIEKYKLFGNPIDATFKFDQIFDKKILERVWYLDFFSYEIFGRTKWGQMVLHAKLSENSKLLSEVYEWTAPQIKNLISEHQIEAVGFVPHSLPRKYPFLPGLKKFLKLHQVDLPIRKVVSEIPVAQKTLKKTAERIENAQKTIQVDFKTMILPQDTKILLIDDAVGSGATLQMVAEKFAQRGFKNIYAVALVGSIKGFEVISEV